VDVEHGAHGSGARGEADEPPLRDREHADADRREGDHRLPLQASEIEAAARALSGRERRSRSRTPNAQKFLDAVAKDLQAHRGTLARRRRRLPAALGAPLRAS
jgi:hypothetical protein